MASGKATPRQKMINMMYLVLTALLALNVSAEILEGFFTIAESLKESSEKLEQKNRGLGKDLEFTITKGADSNPEDKKWVPKIKEIHDESDKAVAMIEGLIKKLGDPRLEAATPGSTLAGWDKEKNRIAKADENSKNTAFWLNGEGRAEDNDGRGAGEAKKLRDALNKYGKWAEGFIMANNGNKWPADINGGKPFGELAPDPKHASSGESKAKKWEAQMFKDAPAAGNLAILQKLKADIRVVESDLLEFIKTKLGLIQFKIDSLAADDAPTSQTVVAGDQFETKLFVTAVIPPTMKAAFSGPGSIKQNPDGYSAKMMIQTPTDMGNQTSREVDYTYSITVKKTNGQDQVITGRKKYRVVKPSIDISVPAGKEMYEDCANQYRIAVPLLGTSYNPLFTCEGCGQAPQPVAGKTDEAVFFPARGSKSATITVTQQYSGGRSMRIGSEKFTIKKPPVPLVSILNYNNGKLSKGSKVVLNVKPDASFAKNCSKDAKYVIKIEKCEYVKPGPTSSPQAQSVRLNEKGGDAERGYSAEFDPMALLGNDFQRNGTLRVIYSIKRVNYAGNQVEIPDLPQSQREYLFQLQ